jgi:hypothetical protein
MVGSPAGGFGRKRSLEPYAGKPHVRFCAGGAMKIASLPLHKRAFIALLGGGYREVPRSASDLTIFLQISDDIA